MTQIIDRKVVDAAKIEGRSDFVIRGYDWQRRLRGFREKGSKASTPDQLNETANQAPIYLRELKFEEKE